MFKNNLRTHLRIVDANATDYTPRPKDLKPHLQGRTQPDNFDHSVCATSVGDFFYSLLKTFSICLEIPGLGSKGLCKLQSRLNRIDSKQMLRLVRLRRDDGAEAYIL